MSRASAIEADWRSHASMTFEQKMKAIRERNMFLTVAKDDRIKPIARQRAQAAADAIARRLGIPL